MALYAIGDLHLSLNSDKSMEVFGPAWENYTERIRASLSQLTAEDVLVLVGDTSWGMSLEESVEDFRFLEQFPCKKYLIKGNHDYWWATAAKFRAFCEATASPRWNCCTTTAFSTAITPSAAPGLVFGGRTEAPQCQGAEPGAAAAGDSLKAAGGEAHLLLPPLSTTVSGLPVPGDPVPAGDVQGGALLLRPSPRTGDPPEAGGEIRKYGVFSDLLATIWGLYRKKFAKSRKKTGNLEIFLVKIQICMGCCL